MESGKTVHSPVRGNKGGGGGTLVIHYSLLGYCTFVGNALFLAAVKVAARL